MGWIDLLKGKVVGFDTMPLIYYMEEHPIYLDVVDPFFDAIENGEFTVITSTITLTASFFLTNDKQLPSLPNLRMFKLNELAKEDQE
jgi:hypothetical protein